MRMLISLSFVGEIITYRFSIISSRPNLAFNSLHDSIYICHRIITHNKIRTGTGNSDLTEKNCVPYYNYFCGSTIHYKVII